MRFNKVFKEANQSKHRYRVFMGSAGSGKSVNIAQDYILKLTTMPGANLLCVRGVDVMHKNSTFAELDKAINKAGWGHLWDKRLAPLQLTCKENGNVIIFRGCRDDNAIERIKSITAPSGSFCFVWIEEASEITNEAFNLIDDRLRGELPDDLYYQITLSLNPVSPLCWIKSVLWDSTDPNVFTHHSTYKDNAFIDPAYFERMKRMEREEPERYRIYGLGEWGELQQNKRFRTAMKEVFEIW